LRFGCGAHGFVDCLINRVPFGGKAFDILAKTFLKIVRKFVVGNFAYAAVIRDAHAVILLPHDCDIMVDMTILCGPILRRKR
jgi:hypothetical protein